MLKIAPYQGVRATEFPGDEIVENAFVQKCFLQTKKAKQQSTTISMYHKKKSTRRKERADADGLTAQPWQ
jgi:hypothetical protein